MNCEPRRARTRGGVGRARGRGVRTRGGRSITSAPEQVGMVQVDELVVAMAQDEEVVVARGGNLVRGARGCRRERGSCRGRGSRGGQSTRPHKIDQVHLSEIDDWPRGTPLEKALHQKRRRIWNPFKESGGSGVPNKSPALLPSPALFMKSEVTSRPPTRRRPIPRPRRPFRDKDIKERSNYGSESSDSQGSDGEEEMVPVLLPRVAWLVLETPLDDYPETLPHAVSVPEAPADQPTIAETEFPHGFFDFTWSQFPNPAIPPNCRREPFHNAGVGPTSPCQDVYTIFTSIWDDNIMEHIARETNVYAQEVALKKMQENALGPNSRICFWEDTSPNELHVYFAIILAMGVVVKSKLEEYWVDNIDVFSTPGFRAHMSLRRFQLLHTCIHFNSNKDMCVQELSPSEAKLYKIEPLISHLNKKFQGLYNLSQNITLDESLLQRKRCLSINPFISNNAATIGIKTFELCESQTGYLWRFEVNAHKNVSPVHREQQTPLDAPTPAIVLRLIHGLEHKGHTLWMDNYYNSPALARRLKTLGFDVVGTLRTNRRFVPEELKNLTKANMRPGQISGYTSGDIDLMVWRDQNTVATISTYHGNATAISEGKVKPILIMDYNKMMGGVDKKDKMLAMYPVERKSAKVWYKKLFRRLLNISVLNSYIIAKKSSSPISHRSFRQELIRSLLSRHTVVDSNARSQTRNVIEAKTHYLAELPFGKNKSRLRRRCCICKEMTHFYCVGCDKSVCITPCFVAQHS